MDSNELRKELMADPRFVEAYEALAPKFAAIKAQVEVRRTSRLLAEEAKATNQAKPRCPAPRPSNM